MAKENGEWIMYGLDYSDPNCIHTADELSKYINKVGFLPLFKNKIPGFSVEEHTEPDYWWCGDPETDPWEWRIIIASQGKIAYGKFFGNKAGFVSKKWLPYFVNYRRDGYDFESFWNDGKASIRQKKIMDVMYERNELFSTELKQLAGFGKNGEKNFDSIVTGLQMKFYLCASDFQCKTNKKGEPYGWPVAVYSTLENMWGEDFIMSAFDESPETSRQRIQKQIEKHFACDIEFK